MTGVLHGAVACAITAVVLACPVAASPVIDDEYLAMEVSGELFPPTDLTLQIAEDLAACRAFEPLLEDVHVFPDTWYPGWVQTTMTDEAIEAFFAGEHEELNALNEMLAIDEVGQYMNHVGFVSSKSFHSVVASDLYEDVWGVVEAHAETLGGDGSDITVLDPGVYLFRYSWEDCPAGCIYDHYWKLRADDGVVTLIDEYGDPLTTPVQDASWGEVKARYER